MSFTKTIRFNASSFQVIKDAMLQSDELPLAEVIDDQQWQAVFDHYGIDFGNDEDSIYTRRITLWGLISQVFFKGENRSCKAAVVRIASLWAMLGRKVCSTNSGSRIAGPDRKSRSKRYATLPGSWPWRAKLLLNSQQLTTSTRLKHIRSLNMSSGNRTPEGSFVRRVHDHRGRHAGKPGRVSSKPVSRTRTWISHHPLRDVDFHGHRNAV